MHDKKRIKNYLHKQYDNLSIDSQKAKLQEILDRLKTFNFLDEDTLKEVVDTLMKEEQWPLAKVLAHLDMIDLDERS